MDNGKQYIFDNPRNIKRVLYGLYGCCALLVALDFVIHRHVIHNWENLWGFYPVYGFVGCVILVLVATWMRTFLMRPENYYDEGDSEIEEKSGPNEKYSAETGGKNVDA
ncbi:MAG: hypothetical protein ACI9JR_000093 [Gammaproteobacteria bacterium]|jgi:hypothetical protein